MGRRPQATNDGKHEINRDWADGENKVMEPNAPAMVLARQLMRIRRGVAPGGSMRERLLRLAYVPLIRRMQRRQVAAHVGPPQVAAVPNLRAKLLSWPQRPKILVLKLDHLGDLIVALPAFRQLRRAFPTAVITLVCGSWNCGWAEQCGLFDAAVPFDFFATTKAGRRNPTDGLISRFAGLGLGAFDLAIDLRHDPDTRPLLAEVDAGIRAGFCAPYGEGGEILDLALPDMEHVSLLAGTGLPVHGQVRLSLLMTLVTETLVPAPHPAHTLIVPGSRQSPPRPYAVLAPGAGSPIRIWPIERLAEVGRTLIDRHSLDIVLIGAAAQSADCEAIARSLPKDVVHDLSGKLAIAELPDLIGRASILIGNDTGTSHLAAALDVPTVSIMGGIATPQTWRVDGVKSITLASDVACNKCYLTYANECAFSVRCMTAISVEHVLAACELVLPGGLSRLAVARPRHSW